MNEAKKNNKNVFSIIGKIFSYLFLGILTIICLFLGFYIVENAYAKATNTKPLIGIYVIVSPSMVPTINVYDMIINTSVKNESDVKLDDIVTFYSNVINTGGYTITHRIIDITEEDNETRYITKGDHNATMDVGYTTIDKIVGKVKVIIPKIGKVQKLLASKWGWLLVVLIPTIGIIISDIFKLIGLLKIKKEIIDIPDLSSIAHKEELENNKNIRVLFEKAQRLEENKEEKNNEEGTNIK